ncbi:MAG: exonuclease domain-containing protein, partial [Desulfitobacterium hafniense]|nr:exonuclease domain-containing protein [Desulfitobacterium hafniense]
MLNNIVAFDVETTGLDIYHDQIIEFGAWRIEDGVPVKSLEFLVRPSKEVPKTILQLTGISEDMLLKAKPLEDYRADILTFFEGATLIGHNISFDLAILERTLGVRLLNKKLDTLELSRIIFPTFSRHKLSALVEQLEVEVPVRFHKAKSDAYIAWQVFAACWQKIQAYDLGFFQNIDALAEGWEGLSFFHHAKKEIARTFPDRPIKTEYALNNVLDNFFLDEIGTKSISETEEWVISSFKPGGILEEVIKGYESRTGQLHMAKTVLESLTNNQHAIIEAGTGTGKSFAYLIPGIWWAKKNARKLIVATHTIPLQEQIQNKDLPLLQRVLPFSFRSILLKGKGNYCCLKKFMFVLTNFQELGLEERLALISILVWLRETTRGDLQELGQIPYLKRIWPKISAESEICKPSRCSFSGRCFLNKARKQAEQADLIIVNHSLLFSDIKTDYNVLPEYHGLIIDEAHHLHQTAIEQLGIEVSLERIEYVLDQIYRPVGTSFLGNIKGKTGRLLTIVSENTLQKLVRVTDEIPAVCTLIREQAVELFNLFAQVAGENKTYRLTSRHTDYPWWNTLYIQLENLKHRLTVLWTTVQHLIDMFNTEEDMEIDSFL